MENISLGQTRVSLWEGLVLGTCFDISIPISLQVMQNFWPSAKSRNSIVKDWLFTSMVAFPHIQGSFCLKLLIVFVFVFIYVCRWWGLRPVITYVRFEVFEKCVGSKMKAFCGVHAFVTTRLNWWPSPWWWWQCLRMKMTICTIIAAAKDDDYYLNGNFWTLLNGQVGIRNMCWRHKRWKLFEEFTPYTHLLQQGWKG